MRSFGNFCVASVLGSSCTTCTLRSCAPYAPINSSKYLCLERSLLPLLMVQSASGFCSGVLLLMGVSNFYFYHNIIRSRPIAEWLRLFH
ncbi:MAG: hypothetical protein LBJ16_02350 [Holosporaceae bacterium]|nr:hypothetical protein [Holosporaceae bacterium]